DCTFVKRCVDIKTNPNNCGGCGNVPLSGSHICSSGVCKNGNCVNCTSNDDCTGRKVCVSGSCGECTANSECSSGQVCGYTDTGGHICRGCFLNSECSNGQVCGTGTPNQCVSRGDDCTSNDDCFGAACVNGACQQSAGCESYQVCDNGVCRGGLCKCPSGQIFFNNQCRMLGGDCPPLGTCNPDSICVTLRTNQKFCCCPPGATNCNGLTCPGDGS